MGQQLRLNSRIIAYNIVPQGYIIRAIFCLHTCNPFKNDVFSTHSKNFAYNRISTIARARHCKALFNCDSVPECDIEGPKYHGLHTYTFFHQSGNYTVILLIK